MRRLRHLGPVQVGLLGAAATLAFVGLRLAIAAGGDVTRFVVAGEVFVDPTAATPTATDLHVFASPGYDGQFFWRLAIDPLRWEESEVHGVAFDTAYRAPRIGYPLLAHAAAGGNAGLVAWSLVGVNVVAMGVVAGAGTCVAQRAGLPALWGLAVASAPGLVMAVGRDLAEAVMVACTVTGVAALQRGRPVAAAVAWTFAVLTREQVLLVVAGYALWRLATRARAGRRARVVPAAAPVAPAGAAAAAAAAAPAAREAAAAGAGPAPEAQAPAAGAPGAPGGSERASTWRTELPWLAPITAFGTWQMVLWADLGSPPLLAAGETNLVPPFTDLVPGVAGWFAGDLGRIHAVAPAQLALTVALAVTAVAGARSLPGRDRYLATALGLGAVAATCLATSIWRDPSDMRHLVDVSVLSWLVLLVSRRPPPAWTAAFAGLVWVATVAARVAAI